MGSNPAKRGDKDFEAFTFRKPQGQTSKQISNNFLSPIDFPEKTDVYQGDPPMLAVVPAPDEDADLGTRQLRVQIGTNDEM